MGSRRYGPDQMTLKWQILEDVKTAIRARDQKRLTALRQLTAAIKQIEVDRRPDCAVG
ncbi:MAG: hypothetical protein BMS9Abin30_0376 [Gammaproteobacteria bacterium]|nr:MAG: hypothetical protein BMS9Abin30_0376 [Gammaproteobacteria bacterium]